MLLQLKDVFLSDGSRLSLDYSLPLGDVDIQGDYPFKSPVKVSVLAVNRAGLVELKLDAVFDYTTRCDRCFEEITKHMELSFTHGLAVSLIDEEMISEARFLRRTLECAVVIEAAMKASDEEIQQLQENMALQRFYLENHLSSKLLEADNQFHRKLFEITGKQRVYGLMKSFVIHLDRLRSLTMMTIKDIKIVEDHNSILEAVMEHDPDKASERMRKHLSRDSIDIHEIRKAHPGYFVEQ